MKKCPNCGACQECVRVPWSPQPWPYTQPYPYWSVIPPYQHPTWSGGGSTPQTVTYTSNTGAAQS